MANIQRYKLCVAPPGIECGTSGSYEQFVFTSTTAPDIYIPDRLTPDNAQTTLNWTIAACLTAEHCVYQPAFRTITISTMPSIRMVVLGDSVVWGQGLVESKKFYNLIAERIRTLAGMPVSIEVLAHSGATLVLKDGRDFGPLHKEVPTSYPTIEQQLGPPADPNAHDPIPNPRTVDLVLMGGCINDINVRNILNPTSFTKPTLQQYITTYCHLRMKEMLRKAGQRFPHANIVVTGYYPILSSETDLTGFAAALIGFGVVESPAFLSALGLPAAVFSAPGALPALVAALVATGVVKDDILDRAKIFHDDSKNALRDAVTQIGAELRASHRFHFVDAGYGRANAMFADRSWLYGLSLPGLSAEDAGTGPEQARRVNCHTNPETNQFICHRASIGHPNENGARNYANEAIRVLSSTVLNPAQP
ncbi:MAG: SGNH/GDSL hydrolase family protein [Nitrospirota bacterium]|nr:SGNH/GDSL hydrolase family protein [Nitrospirota bacterium]